MIGLFMENVGSHNLKAAELYNKNVFATDIVEIIEAEANFYVCIQNIYIVSIK